MDERRLKEITNKEVGNAVTEVSKPPPVICDNNDTNTSIEEKTDEFEKWKNENEIKRVTKGVVPDKVGKITMENMHDEVVWNIFNLRTGDNGIFPLTKPSRVMIGKAIKWVTIFRTYVLAVMKVWVMDEYIKIFNKPEWTCLRGNDNIVLWSQLCMKMKDVVDEKV